LAYLTSWTRISDPAQQTGIAGRNGVEILPDKVLGPAQYQSDRELAAAASGLSAALRGPQPAPNAALTALIRALGRSSLGVRPIPYFPDDDEARLSVTAPAPQFLRADLSVSAVEQRFGPPEKIKRNAIQNRTERKPVSLIMRYYADGAIIFAESDRGRRGIV